MELCPRIPHLGGWVCIGKGDWDRSKHLWWRFTPSSGESEESLTFGDRFIQGLEQVTLPKNLRSLTFACDFNQSLAQVALPNSLQNLPCSSRFEWEQKDSPLCSLPPSTFFGMVNQANGCWCHLWTCQLLYTFYIDITNKAGQVWASLNMWMLLAVIFHVLLFE